MPVTIVTAVFGDWDGATLGAGEGDGLGGWLGLVPMLGLGVPVGEGAIVGDGGDVPAALQPATSIAAASTGSGRQVPVRVFMMRLMPRSLPID